MKFSLKKLGLSAIVCAMLVPASLAFGASSSDFTDLKDLDAATKAKFDALINAGIFDGVSDTTFGLKEEMNRAQFAKIAALITGLEVDKNLKTSSFSDVKADDAANGYALPYIEALKAAGITDGVGQGQFNPAGQVTKEQLATFLVRVLGKDADAKAKSGTDSTVTDWAQGYVALALDLKLLANGADGKFGGQANATRDLLVTGAYEAKEQFVPLSVSGAKIDGNKELTIEFSTPVNPDSIDLSQIKINGVALDGKLDSYELSADGKKLVVKLRPGFNPGSSKPTIEVGGVKSKVNSPIVVPEKPVEVTVTNPPPPVYTYVPPPVVSAPSVTSVTYSVYSVENQLVDFTINYSTSGPATAYYVFTSIPSLLEGITAQHIKDLATDNAGTVPIEYCSAVLMNGPNAYGTIDLSQSGATQRKTFGLSGDQSMFLVVEQGGRLSQVFNGPTLTMPVYMPPYYAGE